MSKREYKKRNNRRKLQGMSHSFSVFAVIFLSVFIVCGTIYLIFDFYSYYIAPAVSGHGNPAGRDPSVETASEILTGADALIWEADRLAMGYDYDAAIKLLSESEYAGEEKVLEAISRYESVKSTLVRADISEITHVFFHTLIMDTEKAFDGDSMQGGYNQMMTTREEFLDILQSMYDRGYVLVSIHDMAYEVTDENGNASFVQGDIMLPEGKKPFVMSQDDVCYYEYMEGDGFASRLVIGEDGKPTCEMDLEDGTTVTGSFDLIPLLEDFIQEHPDFSYKGARAIIAFTGYNGVMGYRTEDRKSVV